jgi:hypothetical protein
VTGKRTKEIFADCSGRAFGAIGRHPLLQSNYWTWRTARNRLNSHSRERKRFRSRPRRVFTIPGYATLRPGLERDSARRFEAYQDGGEIALECSFGLSDGTACGPADPARTARFFTIQVYEQVLLPKADAVQRTRCSKTLDGKTPFFFMRRYPTIKLSVWDPENRRALWWVWIRCNGWTRRFLPLRLRPGAVRQGRADPSGRLPLPNVPLMGSPDALGSASGVRTGTQAIKSSHAAKNKRGFPGVGFCDRSENHKEGLCCITWEIRVEQAGIYRLNWQRRR